MHAISVSDAIEEEAGRLGARWSSWAPTAVPGLGRLVMGSVATEVVGKESLPVILVHEDAAQGG